MLVLYKKNKWKNIKKYKNNRILTYIALENVKGIV